ncbi:MAG TPA: adhesin [Planctomycetota bacterium]|nr:adhesin [Planctomycetota bacterium]
MNLPRGDQALVEQAKVRNYLLSASHPIGRFKAEFFRSIGYTDQNWARFNSDLCALAVTGEAMAIAATAYGQKYEVRGTLTGPSGRTAKVVTVWIILKDDAFPRLVTAYPGVDA